MRAGPETLPEIEELRKLVTAIAIRDYYIIKALIFWVNV